MIRDTGLAAVCTHSARSGLLWLVVGLSTVGWAQAATQTITGPIDSVTFGRAVHYLPNGNIVVTDPSAGPSAVGAVYVYQPNGTLLSTLKGGTPNDQIGNNGIRILPSGNFLVISHQWSNGAAASAGAVTFVNGVTGLNGTVSAANSLVGSLQMDSDQRSVHVLDNGNYLVRSPLLDLPSGANRGAITWGSGVAGVVGAISAANSLVGDAIGALNSINLAQLTNGNYVIGAPNWANLGAAIWCPANGGCTGTVGDNVAFVGTQASDLVGIGITPLSNGHYVVGSSFWNNGATANVGAVTWGNGNTGLSGSPSPANSWIGAQAEDQISSGGILPLNNGHFVIMSPAWANGAVTRAGAATWVNGNGPSSGIVDTTNSMVGGTTEDTFGSQSLALSNGNYVVASSSWSNGALGFAGAVRWGNGNGGSVGLVTSANALVGGTANDVVGGRIEALANGNYVVLTPQWDNGPAANAGAVTWGNGLSGVSGPVSAANSLVATSALDEFGASFVELDNGHVVVGSSAWNNGLTADVGLVAWMNGFTGSAGVVSGSNALIGNTANDRIGANLLALRNGNYMVLAANWDGVAADVGAVTWGDGSAGSTGLMNAANSLVGATLSDGAFQMFGVALNHGGALISWPGFDGPGLTNSGGIFGLGGAGPTPGTISAGIGFVGSSASETLGSPPPTVFADDIVIVKSPNWDTGSAPLNIGAVCMLDARAPIIGQVAPGFCVTGSVANAGSSQSSDYNVARKQMVVGLQAENKVVLVDFNLFANGFE